ncbi:DUF366 family protein [Desulforamulus aquiferis]|uniref:DUF366 family protein n=1 Tax=Desulforamulus aquiferis TaxID=1397668 RepID=A0AAW7Z9B1_9FIRM|nr:DUF366 family protein [Desulforamulus aquiferis]MDO7786125.1 DUF366 family protein [Desulforamulus aquiferis]RYD04477.1 hypothetical protein N752_13980 [Desulforamulus aquiferis]
MLIHTIGQELKYDGRQLSSLWAFRNYRLQGDSIICFRGPCQVELTEMVDLADVIANAPIYSESMLHFIIEHFDLDLEKTVVRQRLFISQIKEVIYKRTGRILSRQGDDLFYGNKKLSVSIATLSPVSTMIHTGLNISSRNTPVPTVSLVELGFSENEILTLGQEIAETYANEISSIKLARCKVRGVV